MRNRITLLALLASATALADSSRATAVQDLKPARLEGRPVQVTTTINILGDLARVVGGTRVQVNELMGPGVDPHLYKASAGDTRKLQQADLVLYGGLHLEGKMVKLLEKNPKAIAVTESIPRNQLIRAEGAYDYDPHVWFDVHLWKHAVTTTRDALSKVDPAGKTVYANNAEAYLKQLAGLDRRVANLINRVPKDQRVLITAHDAFEYFGRRYGIEVRGVQGISTAVEAGARDIRELAEFVVDRKIPAVFIESSVPKRTMDAVVAAAKARGHDLIIGGELFSDALGGRGTPEGTYIGMIEHNARTISDALLGRNVAER